MSCICQDTSEVWIGENAHRRDELGVLRLRPPKPPAVMESVLWQGDLTAKVRERFGDRLNPTIYKRQHR